MTHATKRGFLIARSVPGRLLPFLLLLVAFHRVAYTAEPITWRTGRDFQQGLERQIGQGGIAWSQQSVKDGLRNLSRASDVRLAMLIDRRIDPDKKLDLALGDVTVDDALGRIAAATSAEHARVGSVVYFGPATTARKLRTLAELRREEIRKLPAEQAKRLLRAGELAWKDLAEPRTILGDIAKSAGCAISNIDAVPHDLWGAADLPILTFADRITLVAGAYDLTFEIEEGGAALKLVPIPDRVAVRRYYPAKQNASEAAQKLADAFGDCEIAVQGTRIQVDGRVEDQLLIAAALSGKEIVKPKAPVAAVPLERTKVSNLVATNQQLAAVIKAVVARFGLEAEFAAEEIKTAEIPLDQLVSVTAKDITVKELFDKLTKPYGLEYAIEGKKFMVRPRKK